MNTIKFNNVTFNYDKQSALFNSVNLELCGSGKIISIMGASGSGKSTFLKLILGTLKPQKGEIIVDGKESSLLSYLPQEPVLFEHLSLRDNARYFESSTNHKGHFNSKLFEELVEVLGFQEFLDSHKKSDDLSGGQKQKLSLLRALSIKPDILLLDEATNGLDASVKLQFIYKLREIAKKFNLLVLYVTHQREEAELISDEIVFLKSLNSEVLFYQNNLSQFITHPPVVDAFRTFNFPTPNILLGTVQNKVFIPTSLDIIHGAVYAGIKEENISFSPDGLQFMILSQNEVYTNIELTASKQTIIIPTKLINTEMGLKIHDVMNFYNKKGELLKN